MRMRHGDREAAAEFIVRYGERIRRRVRSRLTGAARRVFDSADILSTLSRRLDDYVSGRKLEAESEAQLWALVFRIADNAVVDKARIMSRLRAVEGEDSPFASSFLDRMQRAQAAGSLAADLEVEGLIDALDDPVDRQILALWLADTPHTVTAGCVGLTPAAVRKRWQSIKAQLRARLQGGGA
jgi:DNA-directed RNA polymerase specialized sigma24 family protein